MGRRGGDEGGGLKGGGLWDPQAPDPKTAPPWGRLWDFLVFREDAELCNAQTLCGGKTGKTGKKGAGNGKRARPRGGFGVLLLLGFFFGFGVFFRFGFFSVWGFFVSFLERRILVSWFVMEMGEL